MTRSPLKTTLVVLIACAWVAFCSAAELIRHSNTDWLGADQKQFERMLRQVFYPVIEDFYHPIEVKP
jgi:hypothetical protein